MDIYQAPYDETWLSAVISETERILHNGIMPESISTQYCKAMVFPLVQGVKLLCRQKYGVDRKLIQMTTNNPSFLSI